MRIFKIILFFSFFCFSSLTFAHVIKNSSSEMKVTSATIEWNIKVHVNDFNLKFADSTDEAIKNYLSNRLVLSRGSQPCEIQSIQIEKDLPKEVVTFDLSYQCLSNAEPLQVSYGLFYGDPDHKHLLKIDWNNKIQSFTFSQNSTEVTFSSEFQWNTITSFLKLGFEHILLGFDHILFVLCLILGARNFRSLFWLATSFTLAHSISLALSVLDLVQLSPKVVEPAIAASIIFLAVWDLSRDRNCLSPVTSAQTGIPLNTHGFPMKAFGNDKTGKIIFLTFFFGLIHGLGFSSILKEANLEKSTIALPLICFNLGVEGGQILIIALTYPLFSFLQKRVSKFYSYFKKILLGMIILISVYWMIERIFF